MSTGSEEDRIAASLIEERAEDLYENAPCGYLSTLPNGTIVKVNATLLQWLGFNREELLFVKKLQDLFTIGGKIFYETHHAPLLSMKGQVSELNYDLVTKRRHQLPVLLNSQQLRDDAGAALLNRVTLFDITDRKKYELELLKAKKKAEEAFQARAHFLSTVSHEFRTPMNAIIGIANLLQKTSLTAEQLQYINILKFSSENLLALINDILDFSRIESGNVQLHEKPFKLHDLLRSAVFSLQHKAAEKGLLLELEIDDKVPATLLGDAVKIGQVLTNLLSNAIKFTERGSIWLKMQLLDQQQGRAHLLFSVKDSGIGISEDQQEKIFEAFTQASPEINLKYGGSGLGLSISQQLLKLYSSRLAVQSSVGEGSEFSFRLTLPIVTAKEEPGKLVLPKSNSVNSVRGLHILLAEDNAINVMVVAAYLKEWGVTYDVVKNGLEALAAVKQQDYAMVFMDLQMPEMNGYEAAKAIRSLDAEKYRKLPIVAFTASAKLDYKDRIIEAGINDLLSKPFKQESLLATILRHVASASVAEVPNVLPDEALVAPAFDAEAGPVIDLAQYRKIARNSAETLDKLLRLTIRHFEDYKTGFSDALQARDSIRLGENAHKIKMTLGILKAARLEAAISKVRRLVEVPQSTDEALQEASQQLQDELDAAIQLMKQAL